MGKKTCDAEQYVNMTMLDSANYYIEKNNACWEKQTEINEKTAEAIKHACIIAILSGIISTLAIVIAMFVR